MRRLRALLLRVAGMFGAGRTNREIADELRTHRDELADVYVRDGMTPADAARRAAAEFGSMDAAAEAYRDRRQLPWLAHLAADVRFGARMFVKRPVLAGAAVATLALGLGATMAIFTLVDRVVLRPIDVPDASSLVIAERHYESRGAAQQNTILTWNAVNQIREMPAFAGAAVASTTTDRAGGYIEMAPSARDAVERLRGVFVSANYFRVVGVRPALGRDFAPADDTVSSAPVVVLSHRLWRTRFGSDAAVVGRPIRISGVAVDVIGVAPQTFTGTNLATESPDIFLPLMTASRLARSDMQVGADGGTFSPGFRDRQPSPISPVGSLTVLARFDERQRAQANGELAAALGSQEWSVTPVTDAMLPFASQGDLRRFLGLLAAAVSLTLLIGCANLTGLLAARTDERRAELAIRTALGASRARLVQQLAVEAAWLAVAGGAAAVLVSRWITQFLSSFVLPGGVVIARLRDGIAVRDIAFVAAMTTIVAAVLAMAPAVRGLDRRLATNLHARRMSSSRLILARVLVTVQTAVAVALVVGAVLFVKSTTNALSTDLGFETEGRLLASVTVPPFEWGGGADVIARVDALVERARSLPGVPAVTSGPLPLEDRFLPGEDTVEVDGRPITLPERLAVQYVWPDYFTTLGVRILQGRDLDRTDRTGARPVALVNEAAARQLWNRESPVERHFGLPRFNRVPDATIVGVVDNVKVGSLRDADRPIVYFPRLQHESYLAGYVSGSRTASLIFRTTASPATIAPALRTLATEAGLSLTGVKTVRDRTNELLMPQRLGRALLTLLGTLALVLTVVGIYGLVASIVARQTREIGIRMALGAGSPAILRAVISRVMWPVVAGLLGGCVIAWFGGRLADAYMYGVKGTDSTPIATGAFMILLAGAIAALIPACRALSIDPIETLRAE